jgi:signal transduction histidine kinase/uncharacterized membrane protein YagU involved in acid resistance
MAHRELSASGFGIALVGFLLTRFTVTLAATDRTIEFLFAGIVPLVVGLGLTVAGVMLAVGASETAFVRRVALWCLLGTAAMLVLVVLTLLGSGVPLDDMSAVRDQTYLSTFLIGGAVGGTLTGLYAGQSRRNRRELRQQANRLVVLNRLLRDRVINAATVIRGHHEVLADEYDDDSVAVVGKQAEDIIETVEHVSYLTETTGDQHFRPVDLPDLVESELAAVRESYPEAETNLAVEASVSVRANARLREVLAHLFENALAYSDAPTPRLDVTIEATRTTATLRVRDNGPGLPDDQRALLEDGDIAEFDDPTSGFGLNIVRLLVESFDGEIQTTVDDGSTIALALPRAEPTTPDRRTVSTPALVPSRTAMAALVGLLAGLTMSTAMAAFNGDFLAIGSLYGIDHPVVAHITHEFHSVVFALVYAGVLSVVPVSYATGGRGRVGTAVAFGLALWLFAAGLVMPVWLALVGVPTQIPNLTTPSLVGHVVWGLTTGSLYHAGDRWLDRADDRLPAALADLDPR